MRESVPTAPVILPKEPFLYSSFSSKLMAFSFFPSSIPVNFDCSDLSLKTCTFEIVSAPKFLVAAFGSSPKKVLPSTNTFLMSLPWALILPCASTSIPGKRRNKSSTEDPGGTLNERASYSMVSPLMVSGALAVLTTTSNNSLEIGLIFKAPKSSISEVEGAKIC